MYHSRGRPEEGQGQKGEEVSTHVTTQYVVAAMASRRWRRVDGVGVASTASGGETMRRRRIRSRVAAALPSRRVGGVGPAQRSYQPSSRRRRRGAHSRVKRRGGTSAG